MYPSATTLGIDGNDDTAMQCRDSAPPVLVLVMALVMVPVLVLHRSSLQRIQETQTPCIHALSAPCCAPRAIHRMLCTLCYSPHAVHHVLCVPSLCKRRRPQAAIVDVLAEVSAQCVWQHRCSACTRINHNHFHRRLRSPAYCFAGSAGGAVALVCQWRKTREFLAQCSRKPYRLSSNCR